MREPWAAWAGVAVLLASALVSGAGGNPRAEKAAFRAEVIEVSRGVLTANGRRVSVGFDIGEGSKLQLSKGGRAILRIEGSGRLRMDGPATLELGNRRGRGLSLSKGSLLAVFPSLRGPFYVEAGNVVAAVRGTDFYLEARSRTQTYLCTCHGAVEVLEKGPGGFKTRISADHHRAYVFHSGRKGLVQSDAPMVGHTDEDIAGLKSR